MGAFGVGAGPGGQQQQHPEVLADRTGYLAEYAKAVDVLATIPLHSEPH